MVCNWVSRFSYFRCIIFLFLCNLVELKVPVFKFHGELGWVHDKFASHLVQSSCFLYLFFFLVTEVSLNNPF